MLDSHNDAVRFDGSSFLLRRKQSLLPSLLRGDCSKIEEMKGLEHMLGLGSTAGPSHVFQLQQKYSMAFGQREQWCIIFGEQITPLKMLETEHADVIKQASLLLSGCSPSCLFFEAPARLSCSDQHPSNARSESAVQGERSERCMAATSVHGPCEVHITALIHKKTLPDFFGEDITGILHTGLALRTAATMDKFRRALRDEILDTLTIKAGCPPAEATRFRSHMIDVFVSRGKNAIKKRLILSTLPNGDWQRRDVVEVYWTSPGHVNVAALSNVISFTLVHVLAGTMFTVYPQHRWSGADLAIDQVSIIDACHGLLGRAFSRMMQTMGEHPDDEQRSTAPVASPVLPLLQNVAQAAAGGPPLMTPVATATEEDQITAEANKAYRGSAFTYLQKSFLWRRILLRIVLEPLRVLLERQFEIADHDWEKKQQHKVMIAKAEGRALRGSRDYRSTIAASGVLEKDVKDAYTRILTSPSVFPAMPQDAFTVAGRALAFKSASRASCVAEQLLALRHRLLPCSPFVLIREPQRAPEIHRQMADHRECKGGYLDAWSAKLHSDFGSPEALSSDRCHARLVAASVVQFHDIAPVEACWASVRRSCVASSVQTWVRDWEDTQAAWIGRCARHRRYARSVPMTSKKTYSQLRRGRPRKMTLKRSKVAAKACGWNSSDYPFRINFFDVWSWG